MGVTFRLRHDLGGTKIEAAARDRERGSRARPRRAPPAGRYHRTNGAPGRRGAGDAGGRAPSAEGREWRTSLCDGGRRGAPERYFKVPGVHPTPRRQAGGDLAIAEIAAAAAAGAPGCRASLDRYSERLARALASVVNLIDPDAIVLGG